LDQYIDPEILNIQYFPTNKFFIQKIYINIDQSNTKINSSFVLYSKKLYNQQRNRKRYCRDFQDIQSSGI